MTCNEIAMFLKRIPTALSGCKYRQKFSFRWGKLNYMGKFLKQKGSGNASFLIPNL